MGSKGYATFKDGVITIKANCVNLLMGKPEASQTVVVTFDDADSTEIEITLNK